MAATGVSLSLLVATVLYLKLLIVTKHMREYKILVFKDGLDKKHYKIQYKWKLLWLIPIWRYDCDYDGEGGSYTYETDDFDAAAIRIHNYNQKELKQLRKLVK